MSQQARRVDRDSVMQRFDPVATSPCRRGTRRYVQGTEGGQMVYQVSVVARMSRVARKQHRYDEWTDSKVMVASR